MENITLTDIKNHMVLYLSKLKNFEFGFKYDEDGHCSSELYENILDFWMNDFEDNKHFDYVVSGEWTDDEVDLGGGRDYIFEASGVIPLLFDYMTKTLQWSLEQYQDIVFNSCSLTDELEELYNPASIAEDDPDYIEIERFNVPILHVYKINGEHFGYFLNEHEFNKFRIKMVERELTDKYYFMWNDIKITVDTEGNMDKFPVGLHDHVQRAMATLFKIKQNKTK